MARARRSHSLSSSLGSLDRKLAVKLQASAVDGVDCIP